MPKVRLKSSLYGRCIMDSELLLKFIGYFQDYLFFFFFFWTTFVETAVNKSVHSTVKSFDRDTRPSEQIFSYATWLRGRYRKGKDLRSGKKYPARRA